MAIQHSAITDDADNHEPIGVGGASLGEVYVADGAGSGAWGTLPTTHEFGEIYIEDGATAFTLQAASAYSKLNPVGEWTAGATNVATVNASNASVTLTTAGKYIIDFWCTFTTAAIAAGKLYYFKYALDGTEAPRKLSVQKNTSGADTLNCAATGIVTATAGQVLTISVAGDATSSGTDIVVLDAGLIATLLLET